jgi:3-deoxy-D-manno-octulosonate 8-phosphate phosphatase (KDO 8-P phosphatase)
MNDATLTIQQKLKNIQLLILDVDGVLTDGRIIYNDDGVESKAFNVKDGFGIRLLMNAGIKVVVVTGRHSSALRHRCRNLGIDHIFEGVKDKEAVIGSILELAGVTREEIAFV